MARVIGSGIISVKSEVDDCLAYFHGLEANESKITKAIMTSVGQGGRIAVRKRYSSVLKKGTGKLYDSIKYKVFDKGRSVIFSANANSGKRTSKDGRTARYGYMLSSGYTIRAKKKKWLTFFRDGKWHKVEEVTVRPRDLIESPIDRYAESHDMDNRIEKAFKKQVDKFEKKRMSG